VYGCARVFRGNLHRCVDQGGGGATHQQGYVHSQPLHFFGDMHHLVQGWSDQAREADNVHLMFPGQLQDGLCRYHNPGVDHLVVVALQHHGHDIFTDIVYITFDCGHQDLALGLAVGLALLLLDEWLQPGH